MPQSFLHSMNPPKFEASAKYSYVFFVPIVIALLSHSVRYTLCNICALGRLYGIRNCLVVSYLGENMSNFEQSVIFNKRAFKSDFGYFSKVLAVFKTKITGL